MKLYSFWRSSCAWRVRSALHLKNIPFELVPVNIATTANEQHSREFAVINPLSQVPCLEWIEDGATHRLTQSVAIVEWLEERYPSAVLLPKDPLVRARVREAVEIVNSGIQPLQNTRPLEALRRVGGEPVATAFATDAIARGLAALEAHAAAHGGSYSVGDELTLADVFLVPQLMNARRFAMDLAPYPLLVAIDARCAKLEAFERAHPDVQPDAPRQS